MKPGRIKTRFSQLLDIDYPIIGAPMFLVSYEELVIAVSEAGGLGMFPLPNYRTLEDLGTALSNIRANSLASSMVIPSSRPDSIPFKRATMAKSLPRRFFVSSMISTTILALLSILPQP